MSTHAPGTGILHLMLTADIEVWRECRSCCRSDDTVVLLDAAVLALGQEVASTVRKFPCKVAISLADAHARGMPERTVPDGVEFVSDAALVGLLEAFERCLSWR